MSLQHALEKLRIAQQQITEAISNIAEHVGGGGSAPGTPAGYPATEAPPCYSAVRPFIDHAIRDNPPRLRMEDYEMVGIQQGQEQIFAPRMSQAAQNRLEADVRALLASEYGQEWLSHDENAVLIDRRYCYHFTGGENGGYTVDRRPDGELVRDYTRRGPLPA